MVVQFNFVDVSNNGLLNEADADAGAVVTVLEQLLKFFLQMQEQFKQLTQMTNLLVWLLLELMRH